MTMKCPNCGAEYVDGIDICTDCRTGLLKKADDDDHDVREDLIQKGVDVKKLTSVSNLLEAELLQGMLENLGIPSYALDQESGGCMRVYMGYSVFGVDIYVRLSDLAAAKECLKEWESLRQQEAANSMLEDAGLGDVDLKDVGLEDIGNEQNIAGGNPLILNNRHTAALIMLITMIILGVLGVFHLP